MVRSLATEWWMRQPFPAIERLIHWAKLILETAGNFRLASAFPRLDLWPTGGGRENGAVLYNPDAREADSAPAPSPKVPG